MKKKILSFALAGSLMLGLTGCGHKSDPKPGSKKGYDEVRDVDYAALSVVIDYRDINKYCIKHIKCSASNTTIFCSTGKGASTAGETSSRREKRIFC